MNTRISIDQIISKSLTASKINVDIDAELVWQKKPAEIAAYLKQHIDKYTPEERRLLYVKSIELTSEVMLPLLIHRLQREEDGPALQIIETILRDKMTLDDMNRHLSCDVLCKTPLAQKVIQNLRRHLRKSI